MPSLLQIFVVGSALCCTAVSEAECNSAEEDATSLVQTKSAVNIGSHRFVANPDDESSDFEFPMEELGELGGMASMVPEELQEENSDIAEFWENSDMPESHSRSAQPQYKYRSKLAHFVVTKMVKSVFTPSSWLGDWAFNVENECVMKKRNKKCQSTNVAEDCHGDCQWLPKENICKTLRIDQVVKYAKANPLSPFSLYAKVAKECNSRTEKECTGICKWHKEDNPWAHCVESEDLFKQVVTTSSFEVFNERFFQCIKSSPEECEANGCKVQNPMQQMNTQAWTNGQVITAEMKTKAKAQTNSTCVLAPQEFIQLAFGYEEGSDMMKKMQNVIKNDRTIPKHTKGDWGDQNVIKDRCGFGPWKEPCKKIMTQSWTCVETKKQSDCKSNDKCDWGVFINTMCDIGYSFLDKVCPTDAPEETSDQLNSLDGGSDETAADLAVKNSAGQLADEAEEDAAPAGAATKMDAATADAAM